MSRKILFVSGFFPPNAPMGSVRTEKLAQYWHDRGHEVKVIGIRFPPAVGTPDHSSASSVTLLPYKEPGLAVSALKSRLREFRPQAGSTRSETGKGPASDDASVSASNRDGITQFYRDLLMYPDRYRSWIGSATALGFNWIRHWTPDFIYSSGPPHSGHVVASRIALRSGVPWIAELRDLWLGNPYEDRHAFIRPFADRLARRTLARAAGFVVVTRQSELLMREMFDRPVMISYNGFDPADFTNLGDAASSQVDRLIIMHAGSIYQGRRDPSPLFRAIAGMGEESNKVRCIFFHDENDSVAALARNYGIERCIEIRDQVSRSQILQLERESDILLECHWQDAAGDGVIPGKIFEYIGARRPVISIGSLTAEVSQIVRDNGLGLASNDPEEIGRFLKSALDTKRRLGRTPDISAGDETKFWRPAQFDKIDELIEEICTERSRSAVRM